MKKIKVKGWVLLVLQIIKVSAGAAAGAIVLTEDHPYLALSAMILGAAANEALSFVEIEPDNASI